MEFVEKRPCGCFEKVTELVGTRLVDQTTVQVRQAWFRRPAAKAGYRPPAAEILSPGGRGGADVRVRLWLWMLFEADFLTADGRPPHVEIYRRELAGRLHLLGANEFGNDRRRDSRARRIDNARRALVRAHILGQRTAHRATVLNAIGTERPYRHETEEDRSERAKRRASVLDDPYIEGEEMLPYHVLRSSPPYSDDDRQICRKLPNGNRMGDEWEGEAVELPVTLWANGWVSSLSASALLALLVLFDQRNEQPPDEPFRVPRILQSQYTLGPDVWQGGLKALTHEGIVERIPDGHQGSVPHYRYRMHLDVIAGKVRCPRA